MPQFTIQEVNVTSTTKGRNSYETAEVVYTTSRGENKTKKVLSFSNPAVFKTVKGLKQGDEVEVGYTEGDQYYNWTSCKVVGDVVAAAGNAKAAGAPVRVAGSNYETPEERKMRQLYIIKQSSINNAIEFYKHPKFVKSDVTTGDILGVAQEFIDFVYGVPDLFDQENDLPMGTEA